MIILIDNYDSFTYNLVHFMGALGAEIEVWRNDAIAVDEALARQPRAVVMSPGPCDPDRAGICLDLAERAAPRLPVLGVCLGHQAIGQAFGGRVIRANRVMHGKLSAIHHRGEGIFAGLPNPFQATRYHSLILDRAALPDCFEITAETEDGVIMGIAHREFATYGVQFHPESIATEQGQRLLGNFLAVAKEGHA